MVVGAGKLCENAWIESDIADPGQVGDLRPRVRLRQAGAYVLPVLAYQLRRCHSNGPKRARGKELRPPRPVRGDCRDVVGAESTARETERGHVASVRREGRVRRTRTTLPRSASRIAQVDVVGSLEYL